MSDMKNKTEGEIKCERGVEQTAPSAKKRGPASKFSEELFERVRRRVVAGERVMSAIRAEGMGVSRFYECVAAKPDLAEALQQARRVKWVRACVDRQAARSQTLQGQVKSGPAQDPLADDLRHLSDRMLIRLLQTLAPEKYGKVPPCTHFKDSVLRALKNSGKNGRGGHESILNN